VYPGGEAEVLLEELLWARLSPDGSQLAFIMGPLSSDYNELQVSDPTGANARSIVPATLFFATDAPFFSPDGRTVVFSGAEEGAAAQLSWLDRLLGVQIASAHALPSDWWRVPVAGGTPERLTQRGEVNLYGSFSPDGKHVAFSSTSGLYVMSAEGGEPVQLTSEVMSLQAWLK
jgi:TolB protein